MKGLFRNKKKIVFATAVTALLAVCTVGFTLANYTDSTEKLTNTFSVGSVKTEIVEEIGKEGQKEPRVVNTGKNDCLVRMRTTISPSSAIPLVNLGGWAADWSEEKENGFRYYEGVVRVNDSTSPLFKTYEYTGNLDSFIPFDITLYQEAVQTKAVDKTGKVISATDENGDYNEAAAKQIWEIYDASNQIDK